MPKPEPTDFDNATPFTGRWEAPDLYFINMDRATVPPFPTNIFGEQLSAWVEAQAVAKSCPPDYVAAAFLSACAAMVGSSRRIEPWASWREPVALWTGCVGLPSSGKSPAADATLDLLREIEDRLAVDHEAERLKWMTSMEIAKTTKEAWQADVKQALAQSMPAPEMPAEAIIPDEPVRPRCVVNDTTVEAVAPMLTKDARLLIQRDELAGWLGSMTRYSGGSDRPFWLESFGGRSYRVDRVKNNGRPIHIPSLLVSINGGIQPDRLMEFVSTSADDGLFARVIWIWPDPVRLSRPTSSPDNRPAARALNRLRALVGEAREDGSIGAVVMPFTGDAADYFEAWRRENRKDEETASGIYLGFVGKMSGMCARIAGLLELMRWAVGDQDAPPVAVSRQAVVDASRLIDGYLKDHAKRTFGEAALPQHERDAAAIVKHLRSTKETMFNLRTLYRRDLKTIFQGNAKRAREAVQVLIDANIARADQRRSGDTPGRARDDYIVNPALWLG
jgi:hypothetical protein